MNSMGLGRLYAEEVSKSAFPLVFVDVDACVRHSIIPEGWTIGNISEFWTEYNEAVTNYYASRQDIGIPWVI